MPSQLHEVLVAMLRERESMVRALTELATGTPLSTYVRLRTRDQNYSEIQPPEYRADLVLEVVRNGETVPERFIIFDGYGMSTLRPWVIGPDLIPMITDIEQALESPGLAALSAIAHGRGDRTYDVGRAGLLAADHLDADEARLYADLVLNHVDPATRNALETFMALKLNHKYEYQSSTARRFVAEGRAEGLARSVLLVLESRGFHPDADLRARIEQTAADDLDVLVARAAVIEALDELFETGR